jgi:hypothetical protein
MWEKSLSATRFLCNTSDENALSLDKLRDIINGNHCDQLASKLVRHGSKLSGTRPYWNCRQQDLMAYAENLNKGALFFTLSAADLHWWDLHSHMPCFDEYKAADEPARVRLASQSLNENPHIAAWYLHRCFELFKEHVLLDLFNADDF